MSIFSDTNCEIPNGETSHLIAASHTSVNPILAVATQTGVIFFNDSGEKLEYELRRSIPPTAMAWHPNYNVLAVGWKSGLLTLWNGENNMVKEDSNVHSSNIINITYNQNGHRMVTTDDRGTVAVWRNISLMSKYQRVGPITHCIFCDLNLDKNKDKDKLKKGEEEKKEEKKVEDPKKKKTQNLFFFGGKAGIVCVADDSNHVTEVCKVSGGVKSLFFYEKQNSMIIITTTFLLVQFRISLSERSQHDKKVRLSTTGEADQLHSIWVGGSLVGTVCGENLIRCWQLEKDENYVLTLADADSLNKGGESLMHDKVLSIDYDEKKKILCAGTRGGKAVFWKNQLPGNDSPWDNDQWKILPVMPLSNDPIQQVSIGRGSSMVAFRSKSSISIVYETPVQGKSMDPVKVLQYNAKTIKINAKTENGPVLKFEHNSPINVRWLDCSNKHLLVWNGKRAEVYDIVLDMKQPKTSKVSEFNTEKTMNLWIYKEHIFMCQNYGVVLAGLDGKAKKNVTFPDTEGVMRGSNRNNNFLVLYTANNYIRIYDLSKRELKQVGVTRRFEDSKGPLGENIVCNVNCDGSKVSIIANKKKGDGFESMLYIYDVDIDTFTQFNFGDGKVPMEAYWDQTDKRFLSCLVDTEKKLKVSDNDFEEADDTLSTRVLYTFFVSSEHGVKKQDEYPLSVNVEGLSSLAVPFLNYIQSDSKGYEIDEKPLKDFAGLERIDDGTKKAIMNFGYFLSIGNMDEAYKSVKNIQNPRVWENMAQMCVKTKRIDVAETCLGNMRFARGAKLVRESRAEDAIEPQLAMVAIQLGMKEEAVKLYEECKRYDLLNIMYQAAGEWDKSLEIAENHDRISLKTTYYKIAKQYEVSKDFDRAIEYYEKSETHTKEVPRMLMNNGELQYLQRYVEESQHKGLYSWWAQYLEANGKIDDAMRYYKKGEDYPAMVRIFIAQNDLQAASDLCEETNNRLACYNLAKQYHQRGSFEEAIQLYAKAEQISVAIKLAMENGLDNEIMSLTNQGSKQVMLKAGSYFEQKGYNEKAIIMYLRGRNFKKALNLSVRYKLYDFIKRITNEIDVNADPEDLVAVAEYFIENNQFDEAVHLLVASGNYDKALDLCVRHNVPINEETIEKILPKQDPGRRNEILRKIAKNAKTQGNFELAATYYMQIGEKTKAAKALIKSGDTKKIIVFASNARTPEIYILAANYLQTCDWHTNPNIMKYIINFYSKAKSYQHLSGFYDGCASVEIDEYRDYDKALAALKEALKYCEMSPPGPERDQRDQQLNQRLHLTEQYIQARNVAHSNPEEMVELCQSLLQNPGLENSVRAGDVYNQLIEHYYSRKDFDSAYHYIKLMQGKGIVLNLYLDPEMLENISNAVGVKMTNVQLHQLKSDDDDHQEENFQEEDVDDIDDNI